jgi:molybdate transport system ATP-binding protein
MLEVKVKRALEGFELDVAFSVNQEILSILGPSGSGKTMTLMCIAGLIRPDAGNIRLNGRVLFDSENGVCLPARMRRIGFVFQNYALFPYLTVAENIAYGIQNLTKQAIRKRVAQLLEIIHIPDLSHRYPRELSSGQQQRVALARAIAPEPELLLLDEPFSALDTPRRERLEYELLSLQQFYKGDILFVTHDLAQGYKLGSRIAVYEAGRVVQCDSKHKVIASPANRTAARLTGVKNLMEGHITRIEDSSVWAQVPEFGEPLRVVTEKAKSISLNQTVTIGMRPEYVQIGDHPGENMILARLTRAVEGVTLVNCYFRVTSDAAPRHELEANLSKSDALHIQDGQSYYLYLPPERLAIITG